MTPPPATRDSYSNSSKQYRGGSYERNDRKSFSPSSRNKDSRPDGGSWRDRRGSSRSRGGVKSHGYSSHGSGSYNSSSVRHDRSGGSTSDRWEEFPSSVAQQPVLTLAALEGRLKEERAIFPTPNLNPCYSLDEFNYPAPPQWYLKAVGAYNKRMGYTRGRGGRGGGAWRGGSATDDSVKLDVLSDNLGYQYVPPPAYVKPTPLFDQPLTVHEPPAVMSATPPNNIGLHPVGGSGFNPRPYQVNPGPFPISTGPFPGSNVPVPAPHPNLPPPIANMAHPIGQTPPIGLTPPTGVQSEVTLQQPPAPVQDGPNIEPLFEPKLFESFPNVEETNSSFKGQLSTPSVDEGDLVIAKDEEDKDPLFDAVSPSPPPQQTLEESNSAFTVSTVSTLSLGRRGRTTILGTSNKRTSARQQKAPKNLIVSIDLQKVQMQGEETFDTTADNEDFDYDDYLDQLNDEEEEKPLESDTMNFWIDTNPDSVTPSTPSASSKNSVCSPAPEGVVPLVLGNPLEEEFPTVDGSSSTVAEGSLRSLVGGEAVDKSVLAEEGKVPNNY